MKLTKIIATVWPATWSEEKLIALYDNGVNVIRLNFSHKWYDDKRMVIDLVHKLNAEWKTNMSLLLDTKWPEIRTGKKDEKIQYAKGEIFKVCLVEWTEWPRDLFCDYPNLLDDLRPGDLIRIESGLFDVEVLELGDRQATVKALSNALIGSYRHINLPGKCINLPGLTDQDKEDVLFGIEQGMDVIAMSFVRSAENIQELRAFLQAHNASHMSIIAKIENQEGLDRVEEIIQASDGVMVARGDLGIEVPITMLPVYQQQIIDRCHNYGKPVIVATQMIESMIKEPFPTRAEIHDIYQAVEMWTDCVMLSWETAIGDYPVEAVSFMRQTVEVAEQHRPTKVYNFSDEGWDDLWMQYKYLLKSALFLAKNIHAAAIVIFTKSWAWAKILSAYKPLMPIMACTWDKDVAKQLGYRYGVYATTLSNKQPVVDYAWLVEHFSRLKWGDERPFVVISDTDTITGNYPTIQVIGYH